MIFALDGKFGLSFLAGVLAAVNPCGFVMLPAYLMYFLGMETTSPGKQRASLQRALLVSAATSAGFISVFLVIATISRLFTYTIQENAKYLSLVIGIGLIAMGIRMLLGWKPPFASFHIGGSGQRKKTILSMFGFGAAYAVASIGCTIGWLVAAIFGSFATKGFVSGIVSVTLYGVGMALLVTALTVSLAFASGGLLRVLRKGLRFMDRAAAGFILLTGVYLTYYWYSAISDRSTGAATAKIDGWQSRLVDFLQRQGAIKLAVVLVAVVLVAVAYIALTTRDDQKTA